MSLLSDLLARARGLSWRRRVLAGVGLSALLLLALRPSRSDPGAPVTVSHADLVLTVEVEGELAAVHSVELGVPPVAEVEFKIAFLAPEAATVRQGDPVIRFDTETLERQLAQKKAEYEEAAKKVEQKQIDLRMKLLDIEQRMAQATADLGRARLKVEVPADVQQRIELEKARLDEKGLGRDLENMRAERRSTENLVGAELDSLCGQRDRALGRLRELEQGIARMTVSAPQDGIVVYRTNWRDEKKKVGDSVWFGETILALPDLTQMMGDGFVDEADGGPVKEGQPATLRLEARPDFDVAARVKKIARTVKQRSWRTPLKGYRVELTVGKTDPTFMRPAMRFRGEIETGRIPSLLLVPRDAVFLHDSGPVVWVRRSLGWREVPVELGRSNRLQVEVVAGLSEGDRVSPVDLAGPAAPDTGSPAGAAG